jgi:hypothetical protein
MVVEHTSGSIDCKVFVPCLDMDVLSVEQRQELGGGKVPNVARKKRVGKCTLGLELRVQSAGAP